MKNNENSNNLNSSRHSCAHLLAAAVLKLWPETKLGIGPAIEDGFYYDFNFKKPISEDDLPVIEKEMDRIIKTWGKFERTEKSIKEAEEIEKDQPFKLELIKELSKESDKVSFYRSGEFVDLCKGGHVEKIQNIGHFKLLTLAGAYWRGNEKNPMLTRIYGTSFSTKAELDKYLLEREEAKKRDHKKIGKELELFSFHKEAPGFVFWHPKGMMLREAVMKLHSELHRNEGYQTISTPIILSEELWRQSGHLETFKDKMYFTRKDNRTFAIKPMNCPGTILVYKERPHSYKELPLRLAESGEVHRHEPSGTLNGLFRVRAFRQDDAHIFVSEDQIETEIRRVVELTLAFYKTVGFERVDIELSTRPTKAIGSNDIWDRAESTLRKILTGLNLEYKINEGEGAFYGPKIDFHIKDSLSRSWQCGTIQLDFFMPERFGLEYTDKDGKSKRPVIIHRTIVGSIQRFVGILIEHFGGEFPTWLAPVQVLIVPIADRHNEYANSVQENLLQNGLRCEVDSRSETMQAKIRDGELKRIPFIFVVGDREQAQKTVTVRSRLTSEQKTETVEKVINDIEELIKKKI